ncbi:hypothetical protein [Calothrix sp. UHCC 0171]|uniref:hypothetical protein n=1 Tax=Calothrix sp. UHCC 0171 TaxID=3110245 RepID=UPI002B20AD95|nr:hypothetical protein [Calothrix sp. UHCC 0171]MEA5570091.1 hypothetical protein [Calothrix sp. UHCC 0171]
MENLHKLLALEDSRLAWVLRLGLQGLRTQLQQALQSIDAAELGTVVCAELIAELDLLLLTENLSANLPSASASNYLDEKSCIEEINDIDTPNTIDTATQDYLNWEDALEPITEASSENIHLEITKQFKLQNIIAALQADKELLQYIGEYEFYSDRDGDLWNEIQRLLLRIPEKQAQIWRDRTLKFATDVGATEEKDLYRQIPFNRSEIMYPGLAGSINSNGLCLSDHIPISSQLVTEDTTAEIEFLAGIVSTWIKLIHLDPLLHHALKSVDRFGVRSLQSDSERSKYATALLERFRRVQITTKNADPIATLRARLDLDEAIHSLVYLPPCDRYSWWGKLQQETRRTLDTVVDRVRNAGYQIQIRPLWGTYADIYTYSKDDLLLNIGGIPGEVSACLRVYAKINDEVLPGRVLFRSS